MADLKFAESEAGKALQEIADEARQKYLEQFPEMIRGVMGAAYDLEAELMAAEVLCGPSAMLAWLEPWVKALREEEARQKAAAEAVQAYTGRSLTEILAEIRPEEGGGSEH